MQWQLAVNQVQSWQRWVKPNQRSVPNQCSNVRSFSGPSLSAHAKSDPSRYPKPRVLARRHFYFTNARIVIVTHRSANEKESAGRLGSPGLPDLLFWRKISQIWLFLERVGVKKFFCFFLNTWLFWRQLAVLSDWCFRFLNILLKSVI